MWEKVTDGLEAKVCSLRLPPRVCSGRCSGCCSGVGGAASSGAPLTRYLSAQCASNKAYKEMLTKVYKELMILGFIAFMVILSKEFGMAMSPAKLHCFEFCDLLVSICVLLCASPCRFRP